MVYGKFITLEGGEGVGKTTQARLLADCLRSCGISVFQTREPGGTPQAEVLRDFLISGGVDRWSSKAETLLYYAARDDHLRLAIRPALDEGQWVLCDRFSDSTRAYQELTGGVSSELIESVHAEIVGPTEPDLTLILDLPAKTGLERVMRRGDGNRFEKRGLDFHEALREGFAELVRRFPDRCVRVDAQGTIEEIAGKIWHEVESRLVNKSGRSDDGRKR